MPSSALTRWLKQGLARDMCPLCRVAHKADREYMWHFFEEYSATEPGLEALRAARGFCLEHAAALRRLEVDGMRSTLGISELYEDTFTERALHLTAGWPPPAAPIGVPEGDAAAGNGVAGG